MAVIVEIPEEVERLLRARYSDLDEKAKVAMLVELYRQDKLSQHELSLALGMDRFETEALLKLHNVVEDLATDAEHQLALKRLGVPVSK